MCYINFLLLQVDTNTSAYNFGQYCCSSQCLLNSSTGFPFQLEQSVEFVTCVQSPSAKHQKIIISVPIIFSENKNNISRWEYHQKEEAFPVIELLIKSKINKAIHCAVSFGCMLIHSLPVARFFHQLWSADAPDQLTGTHVPGAVHWNHLKYIGTEIRMERNVFFVFLLHATTTTVQQLRYNFHSAYFKQNGRDRALHKGERRQVRKRGQKKLNKM